MTKRIRLTDLQRGRVSDCLDRIRLYAIPEKWKAIPGFSEQVKKELVNSYGGLTAVGIKVVDLAKAIECIDYGRKDLAYKYLYETSKINKDNDAQMLDARIGMGEGYGALNYLYFLLMNR